MDSLRFVRRRRSLTLERVKKHIFPAGSSRSRQESEKLLYLIRRRRRSAFIILYCRSVLQSMPEKK